MSRDIICPQIMESVRLAPYSCVRREPSPGGGPRQATPTDGAGRGGSGTEQTETGGEENGTAGAKPGSTRTELSDPLPVSPLLTAEHPPCCITVTGWEGDVADGYEDTPTYAAAVPVGADPTSDPGESQNYLSPTRAPCLGHRPSDPQANSFELEEVHSAGEDEAGLTDGQTVMAAAPLSAVKRHRDVILRGDSLQSDSSGYAEEDYNPSSS